MFERFTDRARRVVVRAQEEARGLQHNCIGTEHILLALLNEREGVAALVLERFDLQPDRVRDEVRAMVGLGAKAPKGHIPFTPRAKKILELSLREALQLHHDYIGTEHILLGLIREGEGVGAQIVQEHGADLAQVRAAVLDLLQAYRGSHVSRRLRLMVEPSRPGLQEQAETHATPAAKASVAEAERLAGEQPVGSHHLMLGALSDPNGAAAQALSGLGVDLDQAREALRGIDVTGTSDELPEEAGRRQMFIRVEEGKLTIEAIDPAILSLGQAALTAVGDQADPPGTISGSLRASASLSDLWLTLEGSLKDIRRQATAHATPPEKAEDKPGKDKPGKDKPAEPGSEVP
jgi:ATP-dependent Clp protease ATP-binding subunit ClpC